MKQKIIDHAENNFSSSPLDYSDKDIDVIISQDCECYECGVSFFKAWDGPNVRDGIMRCEDCHLEEYYEYCPTCEERYEKQADSTDYFFISKEMAKTVHQEYGLYKILKRPFYYGDCVAGFDAFFADSIELVRKIDIDEWDATKGCPERDVKLDTICRDCSKKFLASENFYNVLGKPSLLESKWSESFCKDWGTEGLHKHRQHLVHKRINLKEILYKSILN